MSHADASGCASAADGEQSLEAETLIQSCAQLDSVISLLVCSLFCEVIFSLQQFSLYDSYSICFGEELDCQQQQLQRRTPFVERSRAYYYGAAATAAATTVAAVVVIAVVVLVILSLSSCCCCCWL